MKHRVIVAPSARTQLRELLTWWRTNRPDASNLLGAELLRTLRLLARFPNMGSPYTQHGKGLRRSRLRGTPYLLFYEVDETNRTVNIAAAWSGMQGEGPPLT